VSPLFGEDDLSSFPPILRELQRPLVWHDAKRRDLLDWQGCLEDPAQRSIEDNVLPVVENVLSESALPPRSQVVRPPKPTSLLPAVPFPPNGTTPPPIIDAISEVDEPWLIPIGKGFRFIFLLMVVTLIWTFAPDIRHRPLGTLTLVEIFDGAAIAAVSFWLLKRAFTFGIVTDEAAEIWGYCGMLAALVVIYAIYHFSH
jgi:hypothetical protein